MGINIATKMFHENIVRAVNESNLPPAVVRIVLESVTRQIVALEDEAVKAEVREESTKDAAEQPGEMEV